MTPSKEFIESVFNQSYKRTTERNFTILTGAAGMEMFNLQLQKQNDRDYTDWLVESKALTTEEGARVKSMIDSPDLENYELAKIILSQFSTQNSTQDVSHIQSNQSQIREPRS